MKENYENLIKSINHLQALDSTFLIEANFTRKIDCEIYKDNFQKFIQLSSTDLMLHYQLYSEKDRQMILADIIEYIFLGRGFYSTTKGKNKQAKFGKFIAMILHFVNVLMSYESITVDDKLRTKYLEELKKRVPGIEKETHFNTLKEFKGKVGLPQKESDAPEDLNRYFDKILPKTAGGLWHELLVYSFLLRHDLGFIIPFVLHQKFLRKTGILVPPDFMIITSEKNIYGLEVGTKKEIQSGSFSLMTNIPTATLDTENSRSSDRCPICKRWIGFCPQVIEDFANLEKKIPPSKKEIKCLTECKKFSKENIAAGKCPYTKYSRNQTKTLEHTKIEYATGLHYHYICVLERLEKLDSKKKALLVQSKDETALKTHYPYYAGLEMLFHRSNADISEEPISNEDSSP